MEQSDWRNSVLTSPLMKIMADNLNRSASEMNPETSPLYRAVISHMDADRTAIDIGSGVAKGEWKEIKNSFNVEGRSSLIIVTSAIMPSFIRMG